MNISIIHYSKMEPEQLLDLYQPLFGALATNNICVHIFSLNIVFL